MIYLVSSEGQEFDVEEVVAAQSPTLKQMIEDECADGTISLPNVNSEILAKVIEYCHMHANVTNRRRVELFDANFVRVDLETLHNLLKAAYYLKIEGLLELTVRAFAARRIQ